MFKQIYTLMLLASCTWFGAPASKSKYAWIAPPPLLAETPLSSSATSSDNNETQIEAWKEALPHPLCNRSKNVLQHFVIPGPNNGEMELYLLGTSSICNVSAHDAKLLLEAVEPDAIFAELCPLGFMLKASSTTDHRSMNLNALMKIFHAENVPMWKKVRYWCKLMLCLAGIGWMSVSIDARKCLLGIEESGDEFDAAIDYWKAREIRQKNSCQLVLGDRPIDITAERILSKMSWWETIQFVADSWACAFKYSVFRASSRKQLRRKRDRLLNDESYNIASKTEKRFSSTWFGTLVLERDAYMAYKLHQLCHFLLRRPGQSSESMILPVDKQQRVKVVAIVGASHMDGIRRWLQSGTRQISTDKFVALSSTTVTPGSAFRACWIAQACLENSWSGDVWFDYHFVDMDGLIRSMHGIQDSWRMLFGDRSIYY